MKKLVVILSFVLMLSSLVPAFAGNVKPKLEKNKDLIEQNLLIGLQSENEGLRISSAYMLGEVKSDLAVIPLLRILKSDNDENARIVAALSLFKIGDARGIYAIKKGMDFDSSERVRELCKKFYYTYLKQQ